MTSDYCAIWRMNALRFVCF